jgi:hypothetical protein
MGFEDHPVFSGDEFEETKKEAARLAKIQVSENRSEAQELTRSLAEVLARPLPGTDETTLKVYSITRNVLIKELAK